MKLLTAVFVLFVLFCSGQDNPSIQFTSVPGWGVTAPLLGTVHNITLSNHGVAVYIFLEEAGGWWNKPLNADPVTPIQPDSSFSTDISTAPTDRYATRIIAFLIPLSYSPPVLTGGDLPEGLYSYPWAVSCRPHGDRILSWSGCDWTVKRSIGTNPVPMGPGPNIFNSHDSMVWVDDQQRLHMRIAKHGNDWHCTELIGRSSMGYARYNFDVETRIDLFDPNIIAGFFTWDDCSPFSIPPDDYYREIDIEFSRWGIQENRNSQFVIQPFGWPGNIDRFDMDLDGTSHSVHYFEWSPDSIIFESKWGTSSHSWKYNKSPGIPQPGEENLRINLHLLLGNPPSNQINAEMVLNSFLLGNDPLPSNTENIQIFPNPMRDACCINYWSQEEKEIEIRIFDLQGKLIDELFSGKLNHGLNRIEWNGRSGNGQIVPPGLYLINFMDKLKSCYFKIVRL